MRVKAPPQTRGISPTRSALMARIRAKDTKPEMVVRSAAHRLGFRFRLHRRDLPGTPDLVFPKAKKVIFVHGCFWHRHEGCVRTTTPKTRFNFWNEKFERNRERDRSSLRKLRRAGWKCLVVWECQTFDQKKLASRLKAFLGQP
ncbi:very short patch repair endonuclease [Rhodopseudomonas sp.]|uniref:very short patch repair endonuclease n=1 Tax=Rhodopseudomonas sp. TaxID=1078 RepID=UPI003B3AA0A5